MDEPQLVPFDEALHLIRIAKGKRLYIYARNFAPSKNQEGVKADETRGFDVASHIQVSKRVAVDWLEHAYVPKAREGAYVRLSITDRCFFIGG